MVLDVSNCELLKIGGRAYRVVGGASVVSHAAGHPARDRGVPISVEAAGEEDCVDGVSAFDVQQQGSEYVIRLAYDVEVSFYPDPSSLMASFFRGD